MVKPTMEMIDRPKYRVPNVFMLFFMMLLIGSSCQKRITTGCLPLPFIPDEPIESGVILDFDNSSRIDTTLSFFYVQVFEISDSTETVHANNSLLGSTLTVQNEQGQVYGSIANENGIASFYTPPGLVKFRVSFLGRYLELDSLKTTSGMVINIEVGLILD